MSLPFKSFFQSPDAPADAVVHNLLANAAAHQISDNPVIVLIGYGQAEQRLGFLGRGRRRLIPRRGAAVPRSLFELHPAHLHQKIQRVVAADAPAEPKPFAV